MSLKGAFDQLAAWTVSGVTVLGLDDFKGVIAQADLPALLPRLGGTGGEALRPLDISSEQGKVVVHVDHHLLMTGLGVGLLGEQFYTPLTHIDNYLAAVVDDFYLAGNLAEPLTIADVYEGNIDLGNAIYYGVTFRHRWVLKVT